MDGYSIKRRRSRPEISMAPLIDLVFLLLIFFMLTTTLAQNTGIEIKKPKAVSSKLLPRKNILVSIKRDGGILLEGRELSWVDFRRELESMISEAPERMVVVNTDTDVKIGRVIDVMDEAKKNGAENLAIATEYEINGE